MTGNWEPGNWKWPLKILIGIATVWPPVYILLFFLVIMSFIALLPRENPQRDPYTEEITVLQLDRKIRSGEIKELSVREYEVVATDHNGIRFRSSVNESTRQEILEGAKQKSESGQVRVARIEENTSPTPKGLPVAFAGIFGAHLLTIVLMMALMPFYIILAVKNDRLDQTTRIIWVVLMCTVTVFAAPVYWFLYIWRKPALITPAEMPLHS